MSLVDELKKLESLHRFGSLTDEEFTKAKAILLATPPVAPTAAPGEGGNDSLSRQLAEVRHQNEVARIDREWEMEKDQYVVPTRYGRGHIPTPGTGWVAAIVGGAAGTVWLILAISITNRAPDVGPFGVVKVVFPMFGCLFIATAVGVGIYYERKAAAYTKAVAAYLARRAALKPDDSR